MCLVPTTETTLQIPELTQTIFWQYSRMVLPVGQRLTYVGALVEGLLSLSIIQNVT